MAGAPDPGSEILIRAAAPEDAGAIARIYNPYVLESVITFEEETVAPADMAQRIEEARAAALPWLVAVAAGAVVGYAYASKWKGRCAYRYSVESTVYLEPGWHGRGLGTRLYAALIERLRGQGFHAVLAGIALPNEASVRLHEKLGFRKVAHFPEVGFKLGRWIDVGYWQAML